MERNVSTGIAIVFRRQIHLFALHMVPVVLTTLVVVVLVTRDQIVNIGCAMERVKLVPLFVQTDVEIA